MQCRKLWRLGGQGLGVSKRANRRTMTGPAGIDGCVLMIGADVAMYGEWYR